MPFIVLSFYNHPSLDDFLDANIVKQLGFLKSQKFFYETHTGRYTTTALLALINPLIYWHIERKWWLGIAFIIGTFLLLRIAIGFFLNTNNKYAWSGSAVILSLWLAYAPGQAEGLYWFTGAYTYLITAWLLIAWLAILSWYLNTGQTGSAKTISTVWLISLTVAVAGTTEPIALPFLAFSALCATWVRKDLVLWAVVSCAVVGCAISFAAPGNSARMSYMGNHFGTSKVLIYSFASSGYLLLTWIGNPVLIATTALLLPTIYAMAQSRRDVLTTRLAQLSPIWLVGILILLFISSSCPAYYAGGTGLPLRARNTLYLLFLIGWFGVCFAICCRKAQAVRGRGDSHDLLTPRLAPIWTCLLVLFFFTDFNVQTRAHLIGLGSNNVIRAYKQWLSGEASAYDAEMRTRYTLLKAQGPITVLPKLHHRPNLLYSFDISEVTNSALLEQYAHYFGKKRIIILEDVKGQ